MLFSLNNSHLIKVSFQLKGKFTDSLRGFRFSKSLLPPCVTLGTMLIYIIIILINTLITLRNRVLSPDTSVFQKVDSPLDGGEEEKNYKTEPLYSQIEEQKKQADCQSEILKSKIEQQKQMEMLRRELRQIEQCSQTENSKESLSISKFERGNSPCCRFMGCSPHGRQGPVE